LSSTREERVKIKETIAKPKRKSELDDHLARKIVVIKEVGGPGLRLRIL